MSGIWYYVLALSGVALFTILGVFATWSAADEQLARTLPAWRLARPVWIAFAAAFALFFVGAGLLAVVGILLLAPFGGMLPDAAGPVVVFALVAGVACVALGALGMLIWIALVLVAAVSVRQVARDASVRIDRGRWRLAIVLAGVMRISGGVELGAVSHAWPLALAIGIASAGITLLMAVIIARIPR